MTGNGRRLSIYADHEDMGINDTVKSLDRILSDYGIQHISEIYEGDHVNRVTVRLETKVLPFFAANLSFGAKKKWISGCFRFVVPC